jgi:tRNA(fMet)-specific endonuclease VapC
MFLLDTSVISDAVRRIGNVAAHFECTRPEELCISAVTIKEIEYGLQHRPERMTAKRPHIEALLKDLRVIPFDAQEAYVTGRLRAVLAKAGTPIGQYDVMIAGTALAHGLTLVTANTREFERVPNLRIEDWRSAPWQVRDDGAVDRAPRWAA